MQHLWGHERNQAGGKKKQESRLNTQRLPGKDGRFHISVWIFWWKGILKRGYTQKDKDNEEEAMAPWGLKSRRVNEWVSKPKKLDKEERQPRRALELVAKGSLKVEVKVGSKQKNKLQIQKTFRFPYPFLHCSRTLKVNPVEGVNQELQAAGPKPSWRWGLCWILEDGTDVYILRHSPQPCVPAKISGCWQPDS